MLVHVVLFNLEAGMSAEELANFEKDLNALATIPSARRCYIGKPASTEPRPVVQTDWDYMLTVVVDDIAGHDSYQAHPIHQAFVESHKRHFAQVRVFDAE